MDDRRKSQALYIEVSRESSSSSCKQPTLKCEDETQILLAPFSPIPTVDFGEVRLGKASKRVLRCINPGSKALTVSIEKFPKEEKGFLVDFRGPFSLGAQEEAILSIGWVPSSGGGIRETVIIKYASFKTSLQISGFCLDPTTEKLRRMSFRRPVLKSIQPSSNAKTKKIQLPPNPVSSNTSGTSPPKRKIQSELFKVPQSPAQSMKMCKAQKEITVSWSPQPVHFMDGSFLKKGEESKLMGEETDKVVLPSWTGSSHRKSANNWTAVDQDFMRKRQEQVFINTNESILPPSEESLMIHDNFARPLAVNTSSGRINRRETYVPTSKKEDTFSVSASCPKDSKFILSEIETVKAKLEESGIKGSFETLNSPKPSVLKKSSDILSDIQTNLVCSPVRSSAIIERLQSSGIDVCLDLSPEKDSAQKESHKFSSNADLNFSLDLDLSLSPKDKSEPNKVNLSIDVDMDLSPKVPSIPDQNENKKTPSSECKSDSLCKQVLETHFSTNSFIPSPNLKGENDGKSSDDNKLDEISMMLAEHLSVEDKKTNVDTPVEVHASPVKDSFVFSVPALSPKRTILNNGDRKMDEISLLVAQHLNKDDIKKRVQSSEQILLQTLEDIKKYDYKEDTIYETNLHECKESFLQTTINETSFVPIPEKGYCSTAVKDKTKENLHSLYQLSEEKSSAFCRDLFGSKVNNSCNNNNNSIQIFNESHLEPPKPSLGNGLSPPLSQDLKISSETFILSPNAKKLSTISEDHEEQQRTENSSCKPVQSSTNEESCTQSKSIKSGTFTFTLSPPPSKMSKSSFFKASSGPTEVKNSGMRSVRSVREKQMTIKPRISNSTSVASVSSAIKSSPLKKGSPFKRRSLAPRALKSTSKSGQTLIKMAAASNPKLHTKSSIARHPNLYSAKNLYYDERWIEKQKKGFAKWLNFILTPSSDDSGGSVNNKKTDGAKLWSACTKDVKIPRAPTREVMSFRAYTLGKEMNALRLSAIRLWHSPEIVQVVTQLEIEIEKKRLYVRDDRCLNKDLGIKQSFLSILLNYNTLWLRVGLETIYGEVLQISGNSDIVGIGRFIITRLLSNPSILESYSHPTVPHLYKPGHEEALKKFTLKMFLRLIFFLDVAKNRKLIKHDPCLFCKDADFKMSRDLLVEFSKKFLACEGDITKHLRSIGYDVTHKQNVLDEFDYAIVNFPLDLRCGVRLCRVMELLVGGDYTSKVRLPAHSRLQKIHNVTVALEALKSSSAGVPKNIDAKDIVNGQVEKCLGLVWHIICGLGLVNTFPECRWKKEIEHLRSSLKTMSSISNVANLGLSFVEQREEENPTDVDGSESIAKYVLEWARLVCAHYGIEIENLTVSFSDGRALCILIHHYHPSLITMEEIMMNTTVSSVSMSDVTTSLDDNRRVNEELLNNEKRNYKIFLDKVNELGGVPVLIRSADMSNTIPDRKVTMTFLIYLASRLLHLREEVTAAIKLQFAWRRYRRLREKAQLKKKYSTTDL